MKGLTNPTKRTRGQGYPLILHGTLSDENTVMEKRVAFIFYFEVRCQPRRIFFLSGTAPANALAGNGAKAVH